MVAVRMMLTSPGPTSRRRGTVPKFAIGTSAAADRIRARGYPIRPTVVMQACDWEPPSLSVSEARIRLGLAIDGPLIGYAGHLFATKGVDVLLDAFRLLKSRRPECRLVVASSGEGRPPISLRRPVKDVVKLGVVDIPTFLRAVDVLALPYRSLASTTLPPSLLLEAMAVGVPVVASDLPDLREIGPNHEIRFATPGEALSLATEIQRTLEEDDREATAARQHVRTCELRDLRSRSPLWQQILE
jgi:glycosyltransferase involved in cell wall biosynthesis